MAAISSIVVGLAVTASAVGAYQGYQARKDAKSAARKSAAEQRKIQAEQRAMNAQQQAQERRQQIREERVRRARVLQAANNSGTGESSGMLGALGSLSTQLFNNVGINLGRAAASDRISMFSQNAANFNLDMQNAGYKAQNADAVMGMGMSIFNAAGGLSAFGGGHTPNADGAGASGRAFDYSDNMQQYGV